MGAAEKIQEEVEQERKNGAIIFLPSAIVPESFYRPVMERVWLTDDDIYNAQSKFRIRYEGLLKLANAAGIEWSPVDSERTDNGSDKLYISFRAVGLIRKADGKLYPTAASYDLDLELVKEELEDSYQQKVDGYNRTMPSWWKSKPQFERDSYIKTCVKRDWFHKRKHKATLAESGAKARVIRSVLGLQSQYSNKQDITGRPFVIVRFVLDHQNPDIKNVMLSAAKDNMSIVYGGGAPKSLPSFETAQTNNGDVIDVPHEAVHDSPPEDIPFDSDKGGSNSVDFQNCDIDTQCRSLEELCGKKKYDLAGYLTRAKCSLKELSPDKRLEFFEYLNGL